MSPQRCRNCATELSGDYCFHCGQKEANRDIRFTDLVGELVGEVFVWDSRIWNTLAPLLFRPGYLTAEFLAGRQARYLPPVRLYLVISFFMFLMISLTSSEGFLTVETGGSINARETAIAKLEERLAGSDLSEERKDKLRQHLSNHFDKGALAELDLLTMGEGASTDEISDAVSLDFWEEGEKPRWAMDLEERLANNIQAIEQDPQIFLDEFIERLPYMMFLLLPLFALLVQAVYLRSPYHYLQHLIFSLHYHSAVFLLGGLSMLFTLLTDYRLGSIVMACCLIYLPLAMVRVYRSSYTAAAGKSLLVVLGNSFGILLTIGLLAIVSVATIDRP